jgi:adenylate cyclase
MLLSEYRALIEDGVGVSLACCRHGWPDLVRAIGGRVERDGHVAVFVSGHDAASMLASMQPGDPLAVVFSKPSTHRTLQVKGPLVDIRAAEDDDVRLAGLRAAGMVADLVSIGFGEAFGQGLLAFEREALVVLRLRPEFLFDQTPGPQAGAAIAGTARDGTPAVTPTRVAPAREFDVRAADAPPPHSAGQPGTSPRLDAIRHCLEGATPGVIATCSPDGLPNVSYLSQVQYVDASHVALSFQFFNKTRANVLSNPRARLIVIDPLDGSMYRLALRYRRTETGGPLFEHMRALLESVASHTGMSGVFQLRGADIYEVLSVDLAHGAPSLAAPGPHRLAALRAATARIVACRELPMLLDETLAALHEHLEIEHSMLLLVDRRARRLYTVASYGYPASGVGSEVPLGAGVVGIAAREGTPIRLTRLTTAYAYGRAVREAAARAGMSDAFETEIPFPGLVAPRSQLAVPIRMAGEVVGALLVESSRDMRFGYDDEDALVTLAALVGQTMHALGQDERIEGDTQGSTTGVAPPRPAAALIVDGTIEVPPVRVRHFRGDHSVFLDDDYLIKGVAGAVFWALVSDHIALGRSVFSNRELRLDPRIRLPEIADNLEARLVLLQRRLADRNACVRIEKCGRGRFCLKVARPLVLHEAG